MQTFTIHTFAPFLIFQLYVWWNAPSVRLLFGPRIYAWGKIIITENLKILPAKSFWSHGRSLIDWSSENVTFTSKYIKYVYLINHIYLYFNTSTGFYLWFNHWAQAKVCPKEWQEASSVGRQMLGPESWSIVYFIVLFLVWNYLAKITGESPGSSTARSLWNFINIRLK